MPPSRPPLPVQAGRLAACLLAAGALASPAASAQDGTPSLSADDLELFERRVRPILVERCYECHASTSKRVRGGLRLDTRAAWMEGGYGGPVIVPGDPDASELIRAVRYEDPELQMPPSGRLPDDELAALEAWVLRGAPDPRDGAAAPVPDESALDLEAGRAHWAFQPIGDPTPPAVTVEAWTRSPLDRFVLARLEAEGLRPAPEADRRTLLRRASFALLGLPPSAEQVAAFEADTAPDAWERQVERLLASPHYGERQARAWLDLARYSDSNGLDENLALAHAWRYRDWVVRAFNADLPYDRFVLEQLAGDLLPEPEDDAALADQLTATGFLVLGPKMLAEQDKQKLVMDVVDEQLDVAGRTLMGLTLGCARCHDHKFDPVSARDYYALAGIFKSTSTLASLDHVSRWSERELAPAAELAARDRQVAAIAEARGQLERRLEAADAAFRPGWRADAARYLLAATHAARTATLLEAEEPSRGNLIADSTQYGSADVVVARTGAAGPQHAEYDVTLPTAGRWQLEVRMAAAESRPLRVLLEGEVVLDGVLGEVTGSWNPDGQRWHTLGVVALRPGRNVLRLERDGPFPHLDRLLLAPVDPDAERSGWPLDANPWGAGLVPALVRSWAEHLETRRRAGGGVFALWHAFAELPEPDFEARAAALADSLRARAHGGELGSWNAATLRLLDGLPPTSLRELAGRYQALFSAVDRTWSERVARAAAEGQPAPMRLADDADEALRAVLHGASGPLALPQTDLEAFWPAGTREEVAALRARLAELEAARPEPFERALAVRDADAPADVPVHLRGSHLKLSATAVPRGVPAVLEPLVPLAPIGAGESGRLQLARWLVDPEHPLTARVMANRVWQGLFGRGLVATPSNFGLRGEAPTHPELLDWLARRLQRGGWSIKALQREVLTSATWRMSSAWDPLAAERDPEGRLLWRHPRRRLDAESVRDALLSVSGRLDPALGGSLLATGNAAYVTNDQSADQARYDTPRRSLYLPIIRNAMYDFFSAFDYGDPSVTLPRRPQTTAAPQALHLLNGPLALESSRALARALLVAPGSDAERVEALYGRVLARAPTARERERALSFLERARALPAEHPPSASAAEEPAVPRSGEGTRVEDAAMHAGPLAGEEGDDDPALEPWRALAQVLLASNEFLYVD